MGGRPGIRHAAGLHLYARLWLALELLGPAPALVHP
jgi:hypothetical protein